MALHALFIAVPEYQHAHISRLPGTQKDAEALHQQFRYGLKCGERAQLLVGPSMAQVRRAFQKLGQSLRQGDTFVLYFSGHGVERAGTDEQYLLLHEAELEAIHEQDWDSLKEALNERYLRNTLMRHWPPVHRVMIYDACRDHLEHHMGVGEMLPFASEAALNRLASKDLKLNRGAARPGPSSGEAADPSALSTVYIKSCRSGQRAYEIQGQERGVFGLSLHQELEERVLQERDVVISTEFVQRLQTRVDELRTQHGLSAPQQVWMSELPQPVPLWLTATPPKAPTAPEPKHPTPSAGLDPEAVSTLLVSWAQHLEQGRYSEPAWDCCAASLGGLRHIGLPAAALQALHGVVVKVQAQALEAAQATQSVADLAARAEQQANEDRAALAQAHTLHQEANTRAQSLEAAAAEAQAQLKKAHTRLAQLEQRLNSVEDSRAQAITPPETPRVAEPASAPTSTVTGGLRKLLGLSANGLAQAQTELLEARRTAHEANTDSRRKPGQRWREADWTPELVWCPPGEFWMGSPDTEPGRNAHEGPRHRVKFAQGFWMGRCAVSFAEYDRFAKATGRPLPDDQKWGRGQQPVINVSWGDAQDYLQWLTQQLGLPKGTYHLPSESQWEYACRAGTQTPFWCGERIHSGQANFDATHTYNGSPPGEYRQKTVPVDAFEPNPWGLYNMHGNVCEWVQDAYAGGYEGAPEDGTAREGAADVLRVLRGGSWLVIPQYLRSAFRGSGTPVNRNYDVGFRIARTF